ncbi:unnamed protein product [Blepharisma stoltei]|uniref:Receptor ligand binding region domain-containing protein n=1 Tax=Blepharisma stoltei TaxID=1481888 RepID=A0AAU9IJ79_9CILI|nr:unnamed protein product [Blepharisma stoltei]
MVIRFLFLTTLVCASINLLVFFGNNTPNTLITYFQANLIQIIGNPYAFEIIFIIANKTTDFDSYFKGEIPVAIDATFDINLSQYLLVATETRGILNLFLDPNMSPTGSLQYYLHVPWQNQLNATEIITNYLGWNKIALISTQSIESVRITSEFDKDFSRKVKSNIVITNSITEDNMDSIAGRLLKPNGLQTFVVFCEGNFIDMFATSLENKKIYKQGAGLLIWSKGIWGSLKDGLLYIVEQGLEGATSYEQYEALAIKSFTDSILGHINSLSSIGGVSYDSDSIKQFMKVNTLDSGKKPSYYLVNIVNSAKKITGALVGGELLISDNITFPGNTTDKPVTSKAILWMSLTTSGQELDGSFNAYQPVQAQGNFYARDWINNNSIILENFQIQFTPNSCGTMSFYHDKTGACYAPLKSKLGLVNLSSDYYATTVGNILLFREWNLTMMTVGPTVSSPLLSNKTLYPEFMRVIPNGNYNAVILAKLCQIFGWKNVVVVYANLSSNIAMYETFVTEADKIGINIANDENKRMLPQNYARTNFDTYKYVFDAIKATKVRIFISFQTANANYQSIEGLYDVGLRKGDLVIVLASKTGGQSVVTNYPQQYVPKVTELLSGSISVSAVEYIGEFGLTIMNNMKSYWGNSPSFKGSHFDQTLLAAYGIDFTIFKGEDYENATVLTKNTRAQRITGASGTIAIDSSSNDRSFMILSINNFYAANTTGIYNESISGYYIPTSSTPIQMSSNIIWPGPSYTVPTDTVVIESDCPFDESLSEDSTKGIAAFTTICSGVAVIALVITVVIWKGNFTKAYPKLTLRKEIQFADSVVMATMLIEIFQYINIGPVFKEDPVTDYLSGLFNADIDKFVEFKGEVYWIGLNIVLGTVCFWLVTVALIMSHNDRLIKSIFCFRWIYSFKDYLMPLLGNMLFVPIMTILLTVFKCSKSIGNDLDESYMDTDCYQYCWEGTHLGYAIGCIFALILYFPIAVFNRPHWTNIQDDDNQNIRCQPEYIMTKSVTQVLFITLNKMISLYDPIAQGFVYLGLIIAYIVYNIKRPPYNYDRINMWQIDLLACVAWSVLLTSVSHGMDGGYLLLMIIKVSGWCALILVGLILQTKRFPALLYRPQPQNIAMLFKFMLTSTVKADSIERRHLNFVSASYKMKEEEAKESNKTDFVSINKTKFAIDDSTKRGMLEGTMFIQNR